MSTVLCDAKLGTLVPKHCAKSTTFMFKVLSTDQEMIHASNAIDVHAQHFVVNEKMLLPILKAFAQYTRSLHATRIAGCFQSV